MQVRIFDFSPRALSCCLAAGMLAGCGAAQPPVQTANVMQQGAAARFHRRRRAPRFNTIVVVQVGRSFDNLFDGYPADTAKRGTSVHTEVRRAELGPRLAGNHRPARHEHQRYV